MYIYIYIIQQFSLKYVVFFLSTSLNLYIYYIYIYSKSLYVVQSLYFGSKLPSSGTYVPDEGSLLPKYRDCTTYNDFEYI